MSGEPSTSVDGLAARRELLRGLGASEELLAELLAYTENPYRHLELPAGAPPLPAEPQVAAWRHAAAEAAEFGAAAALARRFPQLGFPIREGMSEDAAYRAATRRGQFERQPARLRLELERPERLELSIAELPAGPVPILVAPARADFEALVRALTSRNEPVEVPAAMGACLIKGLADWERVAEHRRRFEERLGRPADELEWQAEMASLAQIKEAWQDRLILLSTGPYSAVPAEEVDLEPADWSDASVRIRMAHEGFHYLTLRLCGRIRSNLLDELIADFAGMLAAFGEYRPALARRFLGVDRLPALRGGGRIEVYRGDPALSDAALAVVARLAAAATENLAAIAVSPAERKSPAALATLLLALAKLDLECFASREFSRQFEAARAAGTGGQEARR